MLLKFNDKTVNACFESAKIPYLLLQLLPKFSTYSILHAQISKIFSDGLQSADPAIVETVHSPCKLEIVLTKVRTGGKAARTLCGVEAKGDNVQEDWEAAGEAV